MGWYGKHQKMPKPSLCHRTPPIVRARCNHALPSPGPASLSTQDTRCSSQRESTASPSTSLPALFSSTASLWPHAVLQNGGIALPEPRMEQATSLKDSWVHYRAARGTAACRTRGLAHLWVTPQLSQAAAPLPTALLTVSFPKITGSEVLFSLFFLPMAPGAQGLQAPCSLRCASTGATLWG